MFCFLFDPEQAFWFFDLEGFLMVVAFLLGWFSSSTGNSTPPAGGSGDSDPDRWKRYLLYLAGLTVGAALVWWGWSGFPLPGVGPSIGEILVNSANSVLESQVLGLTAHQVQQWTLEEAGRTVTLEKAQLLLGVIQDHLLVREPNLLGTVADYAAQLAETEMSTWMAEKLLDDFVRHTVEERARQFCR